MKNNEKENRRENQQTTGQRDHGSDGSGGNTGGGEQRTDGQGSKSGRETAEQWWARIAPGQRKLAQVIAGLMEEVTESKRIEIRGERGTIRARFIHILKQPEKGCVSAIVLPERASGGWN